MAIIKKFRIKSFKNTKPIIELNNVSKSYDHRKIFNDLSFKINKGEIFGVLGPNGAGKSTLFHLITGLIQPNYGKVIINNNDVTNYPIYLRTTKFKIGYVPQFSGFFHELSLKDNLKSIAEIQIKNHNEQISKVEKLINNFQLESVIHTKAKFLSGGQKKKLVIAMSLLNDPEILILDEPFAALDLLTIKMLQEIIVNLQTLENITIMVCDPQARDILSCVDKAIVISNGDIIANGTPSELIHNKNAKSVYFGEEFTIS